MWLLRPLYGIIRIRRTRARTRELPDGGWGAGSSFGGCLSRRREIAFAEWSRHRSEKPGKTLLSLLDRRIFELPWMVHGLFFCPLDVLGLAVQPYQACRRAYLALLRTLREPAALPACLDEKCSIQVKGKPTRSFLVSWVSAQMQQRSGRFQPSPSPPGPCRVIGYVPCRDSHNRAGKQRQAWVLSLSLPIRTLRTQLTTEFNFACCAGCVVHLSSSFIVPSPPFRQIVSLFQAMTDRPAARHAATSTSAVPLSLEMFPNVSDGDHHTHPRSTTAASPQPHNHASRLSYDTHPLPLPLEP